MNTRSNKVRTQHARLVLRKCTQLDDVGRGIPSCPLDMKHSQTTSLVEYHPRPWIAHTIGPRQALHAIIALGLHTYTSNVWRSIPSLPLESSDGHTTSGVACHHGPWKAHTVGRCKALNTIIGLGQHIKTIYLGCGIESSSLGNIYYHKK